MMKMHGRDNEQHTFTVAVSSYTKKKITALWYYCIFFLLSVTEGCILKLFITPLHIIQICAVPCTVRYFKSQLK